MKRFFIHKNKRGLKPIYFLLIFLFSIVFLIIFIFFYLSLHFKAGEIIYNKNTGEIGEIKGTSLPLDYLIQLRDESITQESLFNLKKLSDLDDVDIQKISKSTDYSFYPKSTGGYGVIFGSFKEMGNEEISSLIKGSDNSGNLRNLSLFLRGLDCGFSFFCSEWGECKTDYNLGNLIKEEIFSGIQYRLCVDYSKCFPNFVDSRKCEEKIFITTQKAYLDGKEYVEVYDGNEVLISRLELVNESYKKLNVQVLFDERSYYSHCYNGVKDYGEDEIDCDYNGVNCPLCIGEALSLKGNLLMLIIFLILVSLCTIFFIWYLFLLKKIKRR